MFKRKAAVPREKYNKFPNCVKKETTGLNNHVQSRILAVEAHCHQFDTNFYNLSFEFTIPPAVLPKPRKGEVILYQAK